MHTYFFGAVLAIYYNICYMLQSIYIVQYVYIMRYQLQKKQLIILDRLIRLWTKEPLVLY